MTGEDYNRLAEKIRELLAKKDRGIVAIDGRCGSGKTTLAAALQEEFSCAVFHMDDFFLRPWQRTEERLSRPGENVDHQRFLQEILRPTRQGEEVIFRPYICARQALGEPISVPPSRLTVVEGSYACHPELWDYYDLRVFLTVGPVEQMRRIEERGGPEKAEQFRCRWIPLEEKYFAAYAVAERCDLRING